jgi:hypothetical protein
MSERQDEGHYTPTPDADPELEAHRLRMQELMREAIAPLLERMDAAEASLQDARERGEVLDGRRLAEARARFRASLVTELVAGQLASNTFDWGRTQIEVRYTRELVDTILEACGVTPPLTEQKQT